MGTGTLLTACAPLTPPSAVQQAEAELARSLARQHELALGERIADPTAIGEGAAERLSEALTGGNPMHLVSATVTTDGVEVVTSHGARVQTGGGLFTEEASLGACLSTRVTPGSSTADAGQRGTVWTEPVPCPGGVVPLADGVPVEATTTDLDALRSPVPRPDAPPCFSGSGDCASGGG